MLSFTAYALQDPLQHRDFQSRYMCFLNHIHNSRNENDTEALSVLEYGISTDSRARKRRYSKDTPSALPSVQASSSASTNARPAVASGLSFEREVVPLHHNLSGKARAQTLTMALKLDANCSEKGSNLEVGGCGLSQAKTYLAKRKKSKGKTFRSHSWYPPLQSCTMDDRHKARERRYDSNKTIFRYSKINGVTDTKKRVK
ncbi:MAG: hypothetical protein J3Q66DRAFT_433357 [Benniella sp.]|nr:MAG: hypothetical protein J3Q66DRAFT_433357 [Benniella sp.]